MGCSRQIKSSRRISGGPRFLCETRSKTGLDSERFSGEWFCTKCGCKGHIIKAGKRKSGLQRYRCKDCGKYFTSYNDTILSGTHKNIETWKKFMDCYNKGCILKECARECEIYINTAFMWRHKISNALRRKIRLTGTGLWRRCAESRWQDPLCGTYGFWPLCLQRCLLFIWNSKK